MPEEKHCSHTYAHSLDEAMSGFTDTAETMWKEAEQEAEDEARFAAMLEESVSEMAKTNSAQEKYRKQQDSAFSAFLDTLENNETDTAESLREELAQKTAAMESAMSGFAAEEKKDEQKATGKRSVKKFLSVFQTDDAAVEEDDEDGEALTEEEDSAAREELLGFEKKLLQDAARSWELNSCFPSLDRLRLTLMLLACVKMFGGLRFFGGLVDYFLGFVPLAFYVISGFLLLEDSPRREERMKRTIRRSALAFVLMTLAMFAVNFITYRGLGAEILPTLNGKRLWFNFLVLNVWPFSVGGAIWFVQGYLYAFILLYLLYQLKWMQSKKFRGFLLLFSFLLTLCSGELAGILRFDILGYQYFPGNFLTRALPYLLLGGLLRENMDKLLYVRRWVWRGVTVIGLIVIVLEIFLLAILGRPGYYGHLVGMGVMAVGVCVPAFCDKDNGFRSRLLKDITRQEISSIYYLSQILSLPAVIVITAVFRENADMFSLLEGVLTFVFCLIPIVALSKLRRSQMEK